MSIIKEIRKKHIEDAKRIVVKIGTNVIGGSREQFDMNRVDALSQQIAGLVGRGYEVVVVSSGSIGAGVRQLGLPRRPHSLPELQATASVGQTKLVACYDQSFRKHALHAGQILLTRDDFDSRERYLNASNTIHALFANNCVPVINENDTISTDEIQFGDNDLLAALVTHLIQADLLVLLTSAPGLCARPPFPDSLIMPDLATGSESESQFGVRVSIVKSLENNVFEMVASEKTPDGTGGMGSKLKAAKMALDAGEAVVIADGREADVLSRLLEGEDVGTLLLPAEERLESRKRWICFTRRAQGTIFVDDGAETALTSRGKSLLPSGILSVKGAFRRGDTVNICNKNGAQVARGLTNYSADDVRKIKGLKTAQIPELLGSDRFDEVVHRDNLVLTG